MTLLLYAVESMEVSAGRALQILLDLFGMEKLELQLKGAGTGIAFCTLGITPGS